MIMESRRLLIVATILAALIGIARAQAINVIINGSFETGDFTGWGTSDAADAFIPLEVRPAGFDPGLGLFQSQPTHGAFAATHGFDAAGPDSIELWQDVWIPDGHSAILSFDYRAGWDMTFGAEHARFFDLAITPAGDASTILFGTNILTADPLIQPVILDTGSQTAVIDLSVFAGTDIRINLLSNIIESFTGPAHLQIDNVVLEVTEIPEPASLALLAIAALAALGRY